MGPRELLVRPLESLLAGHPVLSGASFSGDGELILVLRLPGLVRLYRRLADSRETDALSSTPERLQRVLVVDDSISVRRIATRHLESLGYVVEEAADGLEALRKLRSGTYALVLTDLEMPRMDGIELLGELNRLEQAPAVPILVATSRTDTATRRRVLDLARAGHPGETRGPRRPGATPGVDPGGAENRSDGGSYSAQEVLNEHPADPGD